MNPPATEPEELGIFKTFLGLLPALLIIGFVVFWLVQGQKSADNAKVGDCLTFDGSRKINQYTLRSCDDSKAEYKVYGIAESGEIEDCVEVPGTSRTTAATRQRGGWKGLLNNKVDSDELCIGDKNVDLAKTINNIKVNECVVVSGESAEKTSCDDSESRPVLAVLKNVGKFEGNKCREEGFKDTMLTYSWGLEGQNTGYTELGWDRVLCLGDQRAS